MSVHVTPVRDTDVTRAIPELVLDHEGVKRFNWASQNRPSWQLTHTQGLALNLRHPIEAG
jgi:hypothetical protein